MKLKLPPRWCKIATLADKARRMATILCLAVYSLVPLSAVSQEQISMSITPEDMETWIYIFDPTNITFSGKYIGDSGVSGQIEYSVDDPDFSNPSVLVTNVKPGETFSAEAPISFYCAQKDHSIYFRAVDYNGNVYGYSPIEIFDIGYVEFDEPAPKVYDGEEYCPEITANGFGKDWVSVEYSDNINAGTAYANLTGVFPHTVGWTGVSYQITPAPLEGEIVLTKTEYDFTGEDIWPEYTLEGPIKDISEINDWGWGWSAHNWFIDGYNNHYAGNDARLVITGQGNYDGTITSEPFTINKINCPESWVGYGVPEEDITFDGEVHEAWAYDIDGMGEKIITYVNQDNVSSTEAPSLAGTYDVYLEYTEGPGIYAIPSRNIGQFSIYNLDEEDWKSLVALREELCKSNEMDWWEWNFDEGVKAAAQLKNYGWLDIEKGQIKKLWLGSRILNGELPISAFKFKNIEEIVLDGNHLTGDISILSSLAETNPEAIASVKGIFIGTNQLSGNAGVFSIFPSLERLYIDNNKISDIYPILSPNIEFNYWGQTLDKTLTIDLRSLDIESLVKQIPTIVLYNHGEQKYDTDNFSVELTDENDWNMSAIYENGEITGSSYGYDPISYTGKNGDLVNLKIGNSYNYEICKLAGELFFSQGDVNFSATVDVLDVQTIILEIFESRHTDYHHWVQIPFNFTAANLFEDDVINVQDAVCLVNMLMENDPLAQKSPRRLTVNDNTVAEAAVFASNGSLYISSDKEIAAFDIIVDATDFEITDIPGMSVTRKSANGKTRIIGYSPAGIVLPAGVNKIGETAADNVSFAQLADNAAKEVKTSLNNSTTSISSIANGNADAIITANGIVLTLPNGTAAEWLITSSAGMTVAKGSAVAENGLIAVPFHAEKGTVYILTVNYDGGTINKKLISNN